MQHTKDIWFEYQFEIKDKDIIKFRIELEGESLNYRPARTQETADWARLENEKCKNCPLDSGSHPHCPIALNLVNILPRFNDIFSYEEARVTVNTVERTYMADTTLQRGLSSMLGIYMVTSGCPVMAKLKPMVRYHLPFASVEETVYRAASMHLMGQYFRHQKGQPADWNLRELTAIYEQVQIVNMGMAERLRSIPARDANINALIVLDVFAKELPLNIELHLKPLQYLFEG